MESKIYDVAIIGGGIIGLAIGLEITQRYPRCRVGIIEKEEKLALHQTGHNSGVIHSGIYYRPGTQKARFCVSGVSSLIQFCEENGIEYKRSGKVILATDESEIRRLEQLYERGIANGVEGLELIGPERLEEIEPHVKAKRALYSPGTGIVDFIEVANAYADGIRAGGGEVMTDCEVVGISSSGRARFLETTQGTLGSKCLINCAGLYADKIARMAGTQPQVRIIPFRGEYFTLRRESRYLVKGLVYPVPDPKLPFLGVHFTKNIRGEVEAGPSAVLTFSREGYKKTDFSFSEAMGTLRYPGFWAMSRRFWRTGLSEINRSMRKRVFLRDLQRLLPGIEDEDLAPGWSGVRAQAIDARGRLLDDFYIQESRGTIHILNAPSPGATSSLSIGKYVAGMAARSFDLEGSFA